MAQTSHIDPSLPLIEAARSAPKRGILPIVGVAKPCSIPCFVALGLVALASPVAWATAPAKAATETPAVPSEAPRDVLRVNVAPAIDDASLIPGWIAGRNPGVAEHVPKLEGHEQWIAVEIAGVTYDYQVTVTAMRDGAPLGPASEPTRCECNSETLLDQVDAQIARAAEQLKTTPAEPAPEVEPEPTSTPEDEAAQPNPQPPPEPKRRKMSVLGIAGIVTASVGVAGMAGGVTMMVLEPQPFSNGPSLERNSWLPGVVTLAIGGAALAAGVSMLVVDVIQCRKTNAPRRCEQRSKGRKLEVGPSFQANGGGITVWGRF